MTSERLHKVLARAGLGSRREIERWIVAGRLRVNGRAAGPGARVTGGERIELDGRVLRLAGGGAPPPARVLCYNKLSGEVCTRRDPEGRPSVFRNLPPAGHGRWINVGRLDFNTTGLLLFTNAGDLAHRLTHPSSGILREYAVRVLGSPEPEVIERLTGGVDLEDGPARFESIRPAGGTGANRWYHVTLREGRKREVRRLWESQGVRVSRLTRVAYGPVRLRRGLRLGRWEELPAEEVEGLLRCVGLAPASAPRVGSAPNARNRRPAPARRAKRRPAEAGAAHRKKNSTVRRRDTRRRTPDAKR